MFVVTFYIKLVSLQLIYSPFDQICGRLAFAASFACNPFSFCTLSSFIWNVRNIASLALFVLDSLRIVGRPGLLKLPIRTGNHKSSPFYGGWCNWCAALFFFAFSSSNSSNIVVLRFLSYFPIFALSRSCSRSTSIFLDSGIPWKFLVRTCVCYAFCTSTVCFLA